MPFASSLSIKKEMPQIYDVEPAVASEVLDDELDPEIFTNTLVLSSGKVI